MKHYVDMTGCRTFWTLSDF